MSGAALISFILGLLYALNPFILNHLIAGHHTLVWCSASIMFFCYFVLKYFERKKISPLLCAGLIFGLTPIHPLYIPFYFVVLLFIGAYKTIAIRDIVRASFLILVIFFTINSSWTLNLVFGSNSVGSVLSYRTFTLESLKNQSHTILNSFINSDYTGLRNFLNGVENSHTLFAISSAFFWSVLIFLIFFKKNELKNKRFFFFSISTSILMCILLLTGFYNPFGSQPATFLLEIKVYQFYREIYHFTFLLILSTFILFVYLVKTINTSSQRLFLSTLLFIILLLRVMSLVPYMNSDTISNKLYSWSESDIAENAKTYNFYCNKYKNSGYTLFVPFYYNTYDKRVISENLEGGADSLLVSSCTSVIGNWVTLNYPYNKVISAFNTNRSNQNVFSDLGIQYVVFRNDFLSSDEKRYSTSEMRRRIENDINFKLLESTSDLVVYKNNYNAGIITGKGVAYTKKNPTHFIINIENLNEPQFIKFFESFNSGWKLYVVKHEPLSCSDGDCGYTREYFPSSVFNLYFNSSSFEMSHRMTDEYANQWSIDPDYIKSNFDSTFYTLNETGGMNTTLILFFEPQKSFYVGLVISILSTISLLTFIGVTFCKKKNE